MVEFNLCNEFEDLSVNKSSGCSAELLSPSSGSDCLCFNFIKTFIRLQFLMNLKLHLHVALTVVESVASPFRCEIISEKLDCR